MASVSTRTLRITKAEILKKEPIFQDIQKITDIYDAENGLLRLYTHDVMEIGLVMSGNGVHLICDQAIPCKVGDIFIVNSDLPHGYYTDCADKPLVVRRLWFDANDWLSGDTVKPESPKYCYGVFCDSDSLGYAVLTGQTQKEILGYFDAIASEIQQKKQDWRSAIEAQLTMLLITVGRYVGDAIKNLHEQFPKDWGRISAVVRIITDRFAESDLTLEAIADALYVSQAHLSRMFKKCMGESFSDYVRHVRLDHACKLLEQTTLNIEEVAKCCGLKDIPSFYHAFNTYKSMTPSQYRIAVTNNNNKNKNTKKGENIMSILNEISANIQRGKAKIVKELVQQALDEGVKVDEILNDGLLQGMNVIGEKFKNNEVYVPEVLVAARAMNMGMQILKPHLAQSGIQATGKVCIGTVQGDLHDIGKNLVKMMMEGKGLEVIDLGTDVPAQTFVDTAIEQGCQVICCSALLTTTMDVMADVVNAAEAAGIRDKVKIMVGGAPVNEEFCQKICADVYTSDAASAADAAVALCNQING